MNGPVNIFISYTHNDEIYKDRLITHLASLKKSGLVNVWHDRKLLPGGIVRREIGEQLEDSDIMIALISPDYIDSDYCYDDELLEAIQRHKEKTIRLVYVMIKPVECELLGIKEYVLLPKDGKPVSKWKNKDDAYVDIVRGLKALTQVGQNGGIE